MTPPPSKRLRIEVQADAESGVLLFEPLDTPAGAVCATAAVQNTLMRLESCERVFCSQTLAATPTPPAGVCDSRESERSLEGDFKISYSQTYLRCEAQTQASTSEEAADQCSGLQAAHQVAGPSAPGVRSRAERQSTTPELVHMGVPSGARGSEPLASPKLFPIFRPKTQWKTLHIVRHGESEYNAATSVARDFRDPQIYDPRLTDKGRRQAAKLAAQLKVPEGALWVVSPLTRAVETFLLARRRLGVTPSRDLAAGAALPAKVVVRSELAEHLATTGDIGLPATTLRHRFPLLCEAAAELPERWWFAPEANDVAAKRFGRAEPRKHMQERVGQFRRWVQARPEQVIVAIGHSCMFRELTGGGRHLKNCEPARCEEAQLASAGQTQRPAVEDAAKQREIHREEVAKHRTRDSVWVTYKDGVYDVTEFAAAHPGGAARLMLAAGGAIDPFWAMYAQHQTAEVRQLLEQYRIGTLVGGGASQQVADPYANEPQRHPALVVRTAKPFNAETPGALLAGSPLTPVDLFYVRNHLPVPHVDAATHSVRVEGEGLRTVELSLKDLQTRFKKHTITATLQCTGNRRDDLNSVKPVKGLEWSVGAIGTAEFAGARLCDVLAYAGLSSSDGFGEVEHIQFEGLDSDVSGTCYGASIPVDKAVTPRDDVLLAYEMNGRELSADHGFPVRVVAPGIAGARSVKWLSRIIASKHESDSHWQQKDYKSFSPNVDWDNVDWSSAPAVQETNVQSAICEPAPGSEVEGPLDEIEVTGYAYSGGGQPIIRVDVSADGGATWTTAQLQPIDARRYRAWAWTLWKATVPLPQGTEGPLRLVCKAVDGAYNTQPESPAPIWNLRGVLNNAWHSVQVNVV
ncbi:hypothetical protein WJX81_004420 [Elliptochloris bilobata]|uniref:sulfite oxidase n=1 Tax=Elliptochloris bilobata TaxID=381761 RepID=A0AAW1RQT1_9CHLO